MASLLSMVGPLTAALFWRGSASHDVSESLDCIRSFMMAENWLFSRTFCVQNDLKIYSTCEKVFIRSFVLFGTNDLALGRVVMIVLWPLKSTDLNWVIVRDWDGERNG